MLTFFPSPYPDEWWYSTLCRYHVRSGNKNHQTTIRELFEGHPRAALGTLFPNSTIYQVVSQLPPSWNVQDIIWNHTLFPFYTRMYPAGQKRKMLQTLCSGESVTLTHIWRSTTKKAWKLRYCPFCVQADIEKYGEPFWHREHQLPLVTACRIHRCQLIPSGVVDPRLNEVFYPLSSEKNSIEVEMPLNPWEETLSRVLSDYITMPLDIGPTPGQNNLAQALMNNGYGVIKSSGVTSLNAPRLYQDLIFFYGKPLVEEVFGTEISAFVLNRIVSWNLSSPDRYAFLQAFIGLPTDTMFSTIPVEDHLYQQLKKLAKTGVIYGKKALAEQLGLKSFQLDTLAIRYGITPFWEQNISCTNKKADMIKLYLTSEKRQEIHQAAQQLGFRYDSHFVQYCINQTLQKCKGDGSS